MRLAAVLLAAVLAAPAAAQERIALRLDFDGRSTTRLAEAGTKVEILVILYGEPDPERLPGSRDWSIPLGEETYLVPPVDQTVLIGGSFAAAPLELATEPRLSVSIQARQPLGEPELIDCDRRDAPFSTVLEESAEGGVVLTCEWFGD
jgi:hypothetical protein